MKTSFDEIKRMSFRALDGAGVPQGVDEESAYATAWLEASGLPGLKLLGDALDGLELEDRRLSPGFEITGARLAADAGGVSAVFLGPGLMDTMIWLAGEHGTAAEMDIARLQHPGFLIAFAGQAKAREAAISVEYPPEQNGAIDVRLRTGPSGETDWNAFAARREQSYQDGIEADEAAFARVYAYSRKILVPETEESRLSGAGAGLTDND
ncbi:MAG: DUF3726 domain-containing protein [Pseudomonadota bacterium]